MTNPLFHKFAVFSVVDDEDKVIEKFCHCNNCGVVHKIHDLCKSEIVVGRESSMSVMTKNDIKLSLPANLSKILETYECDLPVWEEVQFYYETNLEAPPIILTKEELSHFPEIEASKIIPFYVARYLDLYSLSKQNFVSVNNRSTLHQN